MFKYHSVKAGLLALALLSPVISAPCFAASLGDTAAKAQPVAKKPIIGKALAGDLGVKITEVAVTNLLGLGATSLDELGDALVRPKEGTLIVYIRGIATNTGSETDMLFEKPLFIGKSGQAYSEAAPLFLSKGGKSNEVVITLDPGESCDFACYYMVNTADIMGGSVRIKLDNDLFSSGKSALINLKLDEKTEVQDSFMSKDATRNMLVD